MAGYDDDPDVADAIKIASDKPYDLGQQLQSGMQGLKSLGKTEYDRFIAPVVTGVQELTAPIYRGENYYVTDDGRVVSDYQTQKSVDHAMDVLGTAYGGGAAAELRAAPRGGMVLRAGTGPIPPSTPSAVTRSTNLTSLRDMPVQDALNIARSEPHLIPSASSSEGAFVGGPRNIRSMEDLNAMRSGFDARLAREARGGDWYDRYRAGLNEITGSDPRDNLWAASQEAQFSAGVHPEAEFGFATKENNASLMGMPVKAARPAQHEAHLRAIAENNPSRYQLGLKTGEYGRKINPDLNTVPTATGVNDFRHARELGFTEASGEAQRNALGPAQHTFSDYETALAVDRANQSNLAGRNNWTGEQIQAANWVSQKAGDIYKKRGPVWIREGLKQGMSPAEAEIFAREQSFNEANKTIADYFDKHTANATHEAMVGSETGHMPGSINATQAEREAFSNDPLSSWAFAPGGRDAMYSGLRLGDTGVSARVRPTVDMTGVYTNPQGITETNPGWVARPIVALDNSGKTKALMPADRAMLEGGETTRAAIDAQNAGAAHIPLLGGQLGESNSFFTGMDRPITIDEANALRIAAKEYGLGDVVDTGRGVTTTSFYPPPPKMSPKASKALAEKISQTLPDATSINRAKIDSIYADLADKWPQGHGSGAVTREVLSKTTRTPEMRSAFNNNPYIPEAARNRIARDNSWESAWGKQREDLGTFRRIIGEGPGWIDRLEEALKSGVPLPAVAVGGLGAASYANGKRDDDI